MKSNSFHKLVFAASFVLLFASPSHAQSVSYDRYASVYQHPARTSLRKNIAQHFLLYPFELLRWPMDKGLIFTEEYHIDKKAQWIYDKIGEQGIIPYVNIISIGNFGAGADVDFIRLARFKENFPDAVVKSWIQWTHSVNFEVGSRLGFERFLDTNFRTFGTVKYQNKPEEHFYGIGPHTSAGDGTSYRIEQTTLEASAGYNWVPNFSLDGNFAFHNVNITNGEDGGRGQVDRTFAPAVINGLGGDEMISLGLDFNHDTRNMNENSTTGGQERLTFSFYEGLDDSNASFFKYTAEASRYFRLGSDRRILAFHVYGEHNDENAGHYVPFHQMAKLGGFGSYPRSSHTLRGFDFNRFFDDSAALLNVEYRYNIWQYRDFKVDSVIFLDEGQVFGEFSEFMFNDFRESYGLGFRLIAANHIIFSLEIAHGDEGTQFYAKSSSPF
ncbi:MAG: BamA/TamA family outer membrane protein [Candidatus Omnitrophica bacterium]|nr:BamA/TamA family outer membrane protein [Candidatus Omnitrophota bacterium]